MNKSLTQKTVQSVRAVPSGDVSKITHCFHKQQDVLTPMRDGVSLAMDLLMPEGGGPFPVILTRTPYDKTGSCNAAAEDYARRGYVVAMQDCRGRFNSDGNFEPYQQEHNDGFDTIEWLAEQEWCDGNVGMIGGSYAGQTQWYAASQAPKALKAIVPTESPPGNLFLNEPMYGGVMILCMVEWMALLARRSVQKTRLLSIFAEHKPYFEPLTPQKSGEATATNSTWWKDVWLNHPHYDDYWHDGGYEQYWQDMTVPALNITGWWGMNFLGAPRNFVGMREQGANPEARDGQRLVIGPWPHWVNTRRELNGQDFGPDAVTDLSNYTLKFFDYWLKGKKDNSLNNDKRVHVFVVGADQWWEADTWPLPGIKPTPLYLHSAGNANTHRGDGVANFDKPVADEPDDSYVSDPNDPVRTHWNLRDGPVDDREATNHPSVLCYTSEVLTDAMDVVGDVSGVLYAASSAKDCDWHIRLVDVHPDGSARFLCHGALRARYREGFDKTVLLSPNEVTRFDIDMTATGIRFLPGHRIRIEIASSWFNRFDRNTQTGADNWMRDESTPVIAQQVVKHNLEYPSHIILPIIVDGPD
ncbi:CocE/NonD family hydrolase [Porticoccaceae bacterium]|nr:CocE/NonD family hydrolase [Porticoccaceae bacterium]